MTDYTTILVSLIFLITNYKTILVINSEELFMKS